MNAPVEGTWGDVSAASVSGAATNAGACGDAAPGQCATMDTSYAYYQLQPSDLLDAATLCRSACAPALAADWEAPAGTLTWTCRRTLDHIVDTLCLYARYVASWARERLPIARDGTPTLSVADLLRLVEPIAAVLAEVARAAPPGTRVYHHGGLADVEGYVAMDCDEILIHTSDIAQGLGVPFRPPDALSRRVLAQLFPRAPAGTDPWATLLWANGRAALADRPRLEADWYWWCAPLEEWDGTIRKCTAPPGIVVSISPASARGVPCVAVSPLSYRQERKMLGRQERKMLGREPAQSENEGEVT